MLNEASADGQQLGMRDAMSENVSDLDNATRSSDENSAGLDESDRRRFTECLTNVFNTLLEFILSAQSDQRTPRDDASPVDNPGDNPDDESTETVSAASDDDTSGTVQTAQAEEDEMEQEEIAVISSGSNSNPDTPVQDDEIIDITGEQPSTSRGVEDDATHGIVRRIEVLHRPENRRVYRRREMHKCDKMHLRPLYIDTSRRPRPYHLLPIRHVPIAYVRPRVRTPPPPQQSPQQPPQQSPQQQPPQELAPDDRQYPEYSGYELPPQPHQSHQLQPPHPWMEASTSSAYNYESGNGDSEAGPSGQYSHRTHHPY